MTEENHEEPQSGYPVSSPKYKSKVSAARQDCSVLNSADTYLSGVMIQFFISDTISNSLFAVTLCNYVFSELG